ncbi:MAG: UMP kinase [Clostridiales bacterium]|nr:UMP kinase [Clostridiales bacterium]
MIKYKRILLKISGEALSDGLSGISGPSTVELAKQLKQIWQTGVQLAIVVGGGNIWRGREIDTMDRANADNIGMLATVMNGLALGEALAAQGVDNKVVSSFAIDKLAERHFLPNVLKYLEEKKVVIFVGGTGAPYFSTDTAASLRACEIHADAMICLKAVDGIYDSDPKTNPKAKKYDELTYDKIIADNLKALDLTAIAMCREFGVKVITIGKDEPNGVLRVLNGEKLGTIIK